MLADPPTRRPADPQTRGPADPRTPKGADGRFRVFYTVMRHADAGYDIAKACAREYGLNLPSLADE